MDTLREAIDVCDVDGFCFGNYTDEEAGTGCTVIVAPEGATGGDRRNGCAVATGSNNSSVAHAAIQGL